MKLFAGVIIVLALVGLGAYVYMGNSPRQVTPPASKSAPGYSFNAPVQPDQFAFSSPEHRAILATPPTKVEMRFDVPITEESSMTIKRFNQEFGQGDVTLDSEGTLMRRAMDVGAPDGVYVVAYTVCFSGAACQDGSFEFAIDRTSK